MATTIAHLTFSVPQRRVKVCLAICTVLSVLPKASRDRIADRITPIMARWIAGGMAVVRE